MKHYFSSLKGDTIKAIFLVCLAVGVVGMSYGSLAMAYGFPLWVPFVLSITVLAGASEFMFIGIVASGGNPLAAAAAGLLVNARHVPFGVTVRDLVGSRAASFLGCHIMNDESVVFGLSQKTPEQRKAAYWLCGLGVAIFWPVGTLIGAGVGKLLPAPETIGLDAVFPAILLALVVPAFKNRTTLIRACSGAGLSLVAIPFAPVGLPVLLSLFGLLTRKNNGQHDAVYHRYRHLISGNLFNAFRRSEAWESFSVLGTRRRCFPTPQRYYCSPLRWRPPFTKANTLPVWRGFLGLASRYFSPGASCR